MRTQARRLFTRLKPGIFTLVLVEGVSRNDFWNNERDRDIVQAHWNDAKILSKPGGFAVGYPKIQASTSSSGQGQR